MATSVSTPRKSREAVLKSGGKLNRRGFLVRAGGGLSLGFFLPEAGHFFDMAAAPTNQDLANAYIRIGTNNSITLMFGGCEMGQGSKSGLAQILAEELMVDWNQIVVEQSLVDPIVSYGTGGSSAVAGRYARLRTAGAACRELLIQAAMDNTGDTNRNNYSAQSGRVFYNGAPAGSWTFGSLAAAAATKTVPADLRLTNPSNFRLIGKSLPRVDIPSKTDGSAKYGIDTWMPGMVFAAIKHCPVIGGVLAAAPAKPSGAIAVVPCFTPDSRGSVVAGSYNAVAVVANNTWTAKNLANSLRASWTLPASTASVDSAALLAQAQGLMSAGVGALVAEPAPPAGFTPGSYAPVIEPLVASALGAAPAIDSTYSVPYVAHATMEVLNCSVNIVFDAAGAPQSAEVWAPNQNAGSVANYTAAVTGLPTQKITVHITYLGGGLGRKIEQDYISQAVQVAMALKKPVKLTWTREEDFSHDQYRPMALANVKATLNGSSISAWQYRTVTPSISAQRGRLAAGAVDSQAVECARNTPYNLGTHVVEWIPLPAGIPVGYWRSVGASINVFVVESAIDELAAAAGVDPFTFRYGLLTDIPDTRARNVLAKADAMSAWRHSLPAGHAWGVALGEAFRTFVCEVVEISQPAAGSIRVHRVACAVDCGMAINPNSVEAQMQGGIVHGLNATLWGRTTFTAGKANQRNFNVSRMMRLNEMPQVTVEVVQSTTTSPTGTGEPGVPPIAPAVANAYARLTGTRVRSLPFFPNATMGGL